MRITLSPYEEDEEEDEWGLEEDEWGFEIE